MSSKLEVVLSVVESGMDAFKNAAKSIDDLKKGTGGLNAVMVNMAATLNVAKAAYNAVGGVVKSVVINSMNLADALENQAKQAGVSTKTLQEYGYAAKINGSSVESMANALTKLTENSYKAFTGNKELSEAFSTLGVNLRNAKGEFRDQNEVVRDTMNRLADLKNPAQQTALAIQLLGKGGKDLIPTLRDGSDGLATARGEAEKLGQVLSESAIKRLAETEDAFANAGTAAKNAFAEAIANFSPTLTWLAEKARDASIGFRMMFAPTENDKAVNEMKKLNSELERLKTLSASLGGKNEALNDQINLLTRQYNLRVSLLKVAPEDRGSGTDPKTGTPPPTVTGDPAAAEKAKKDAMKRMQDDKKAADDWQVEDAKARWEIKQKALQDEKEARDKINKDAEDALKKHNDVVANLDATLAQVKIKNEKDAVKAAGLQWKENDRLAREGYRKTVQSAKGNAKEVALANEVMTETIKANESEYYETVKQIEAQKKANNIANAREQLGVLTDVLKEAASKNKAAAVAYKGIAIATTIIDTYSGAQKAFNSLASIPYVGYALGLVAAGATVAAGLLRVNEIRKQQFVSGGESSGGMALVGEMGPEYVNLPRGSQVINHHQTSQMINNANRSSTVLNVTIQGTRGTASQQLVTEIRGGKSDYLIKQIAKALGV